MTSAAATEFAGRAALVTGAGTGLGEAIVERLVAGGACVVLANRHGDPARKVARRVDPAGRCTVVTETDVRHASAVEAMVATAVDAFGGLHLAVNCAGITGPLGPVTELDEQDWRDVLDTDLTGVFLGLKYEIPAMLASGGGAIVNMSSANGTVGVPGLAAYTAAKHGIIGLTRAVALETAGQNVRVCAVAPGYVDTPRIRAAGDEVVAQMAASHPIGRLVTRAEVADLVAYLLSDRAAAATGSVHVLDGGYTAA